MRDQSAGLAVLSQSIVTCRYATSLRHMAEVRSPPRKRRRLLAATSRSRRRGFTNSIKIITDLIDKLSFYNTNKTFDALNKRVSLENGICWVSESPVFL